jgi:hypothetical protein
MACASVNEPVKRNIGLTRRQMVAALAGMAVPVLGPSLGHAAAQPAGKPSPQRTPVSLEAAAVAEIAGMSGVRLWADRPDDFLALVREAPEGADASWLALSGGGEDGAYGAGVLAGWTASGTRPDFAVVTGVSTGALIAPYAFLGPRYDQALKHAYTTIRAADVFEIAGTEDSLFSTWPLRDTIARQVTPELLLAVAAEHRRGRRLLVLTTNIDTARPVLWNMGAIAAHGGPEALALFRKVLLASASIPGLFPPVMIDVVGQGRQFQEMHVDGGASAYLFVAPQPMLLDDRFDERLPAARLYVILNNTLRPDFAMTERATSAVLGRAMSVGTRALTTLEIAALVQLCRRQSIDFNLTFVDEGFALSSSGSFDPAYMGALFAYGYEQAASGAAFGKALPTFPKRLERSVAERTLPDLR